MSYQLRNNQVDPVKIGIDFFASGSNDPSIIVAPTAFGKSIVIAHTAAGITGKTLIIQPSKELLEQNFQKFIALGGEASIFSASFKSKEFGQITYATIGSIKNLGKKFKEYGYNNLIVDEVDRYPRTADSMFGNFIKESCISSVLGFTATPFKLQTTFDPVNSVISKLVMLTNKSKKGNFFKKILHVVQIQDIIKDGYWSPLEYEYYDFDKSLLVYNSTKSEYTEESIIAAYSQENIETKVIERIKTLDRKHALVFMPSVLSAVAISRKVKNSAAVYGTMNSKEREKIIKDFKKGKIKYLFNFNVLSIGFDFPGIDTIILARSTASLSFYYQVIGRGVRIDPNKKDCLIIDFAGNIEKFGKIEHLHFKEDNNIWRLYGEKERLLTGVPMHLLVYHEDDLKATVMPFGKYKGIEVKQICFLNPGYAKWVIENVDFKKESKHLKTLFKEELESPTFKPLETTIEKPRPKITIHLPGVNGKKKVYYPR